MDYAARAPGRCTSTAPPRALTADAADLDAISVDGSASPAAAARPPGPGRCASPPSATPTRRVSPGRPTTRTSTAGTAPSYIRDVGRVGAAVRPAGRGQRGRLHPGRRHALLPVVRERHHVRCPGSGPCRTRTSCTGTTARGRCTSTARRTGSAGARAWTSTRSAWPRGRCTSRRSGNTNPPGVGGTADDADVYSWNGTSYCPGLGRDRQRGAGGRLTWTGWTGWTPRTSTCRSRATPPRPCPGSAAVQDEDVVYRDDGTWSIYFDGTAHGLTHRQPRRRRLRRRGDAMTGRPRGTGTPRGGTGMSEKQGISRRTFLTFTGGAVAVAGGVTWAGGCWCPRPRWRPRATPTSTWPAPTAGCTCPGRRPSRRSTRTSWPRPRSRPTSSGSATSPA